MTPNTTSIFLAALGVLAIVAKSAYIAPAEHPAMETAFGLIAGVFLLGFAWRQAAGRLLPARSASPARPRPW